VYFNPCDFVNRATCKEEHEIAIWTEDKQLLVLYNQQEFNSRKAEE
jgi:5'-3' exonuclease